MSHPGYAEHRQPVYVRASDQTIPAIVLKTQVIELDGIRADATGRRAAAERAAGFRREAHVAAGARMADLERHGVTPVNAIRELGPLRVFTFMTPQGRTRTCIESIRRMDVLSDRQRRPYGAGRGEEDICQWVIVVIDDVVISDPETMLRSLKLQDFESVEYVAPVDAGFRYGPDASSLGAVVLWSRGLGPHVSADRNRIR